MKKTLAPCDLTVTIDTRESRPLDIKEFKTIRKCLKTADYSIEGMESQIAVELKELGDFISCCTYNRDRFERALVRLREYPYRAIVIKSDWDKIISKQYRGSTNPLAVLGSAMAFALSANVSIIMAGDHTNASILVSRLLWVSANRIHRKEYEQWIASSSKSADQKTLKDPTAGLAV